MKDAVAAPPPRDAAAGQLPRQIPYIIGNEACERFSFYGMRNILTPFLDHARCCCSLPEAERAGIAKDVFHTFVIGVYFFPLLGGWLSDRFFGKYNTVFWFSLVYCAGHACLAMFEDNRTGFYTGLFLIALGSGGIKPLVVGLRRRPVRPDATSAMAKVVFDAFYWIDQLRLVLRLAADAAVPAQASGAAWAFGIPGILMFIATVIFWAGPQEVRAACRRRRRIRTRSSASRARRSRSAAPGAGTARPARWLVLGVAMLAAGRRCRCWPGASAS